MSEKNKKILIGLVIAALLVVLVNLFFRSSQLDEYKNTVAVELAPEVEQFAIEVLQYIEKDDMKRLFQVMFSSDYGLFQSNYVKGLFAQKDFAPAEFTGKIRKVSKSSTENIMIELHSVNRNTNYWLSLVKTQTGWKVAGISNFELPK